jgi:hypothetical protein
MASHLLLRLKSMLRDRILLAVTLLVALGSLSPLASAFDDGRSYSWGIDSYRDRRMSLLAVEHDVRASAPPEFIALYDAEVQALTEVLQAHASHDAQGEFMARLGLARADLDMSLAGYSTMEPIIAEGRVAFYQQLIERGIYGLPLTVSAQPASFYLASLLSTGPPAALYIPAAASFAVAFASSANSRSRRLEDIVPQSSFWVLCADFLAGMAATAFILLASLMPAFMLQMARNGLGDLGFPVVNVIDGNLAVATVGGYLGSLSLLVLLGSCFVGSLGLLLSRIIDSRTVMLLALMLFIYAVNGSRYYAFVETSDVEALLPMTYLSVPSIIGVVSPSPYISSFAGVGLPLGAAVLLASTALTAAMSPLSNLVAQAASLLSGSPRVVLRGPGQAFSQG